MPGNAGTQLLAENIELDINDFEKVLKFLKKVKVDFVIVGPEKPLVNGIVDYLEKNNIKVFGPRKIPSQLEGSKTFTKKLCKKYNPGLLVVVNVLGHANNFDKILRLKKKLSFTFFNFTQKSKTYLIFPMHW